MKNKIISIILSALMLAACLCAPALATADAPATFTSGKFTVIVPGAEGQIALSAEDVVLPEVTVNYFNGVFDNEYDASFYGAYKVTLTKDSSDIAFTEDMTVLVDLGEQYATKSFFLIYINDDATVSHIAHKEREGSVLSISGNEFNNAAGKTIVVMTTDRDITAENFKFPVVSAVICGVVAIAAVAGAVVVLKKKKESSGIID